MNRRNFLSLAGKAAAVTAAGLLVPAYVRAESLMKVQPVHTGSLAELMAERDHLTEMLHDLSYWRKTNGQRMTCELTQDLVRKREVITRRIMAAGVGVKEPRQVLIV